MQIVPLLLEESENKAKKTRGLSIFRKQVQFVKDLLQHTQL